jgi:hypothetical protein
MRGVYSLEDIRLRCVIDEETGCWLWKHGKSGGYPRTAIPAGVFGEKRITTMPALKAAFTFANSGKLTGHTVYRSAACPNLDCVCPYHAKRGGPSDVLREHAKRRDSFFFKPERRARISRLGKAKELPQESVQAILQDLQAGMLQRDVAAKHGVHKDTVSKISRGIHSTQRQQTLRGASVFNWLGLEAA